MIAEIDRISNPIQFESNDRYPQNGDFDIPWKNVRFNEGIMMIFHPNPSKRGSITPFYFRHPDILKSFEDIRSYIEIKCSKLRVRSVDGVIVSLQNFTEFMSHITQYSDWEEEENIGFGEPLSRAKNININPQAFIRNSNVKKSPYLRHLASIHLQAYNITYLLERVIHESGFIDNEEYGYLFVLKKNISEMILLIENISDISRSSIIFYVNPLMYNEAVNVIKNFFACDYRNKRQKLSLGKIKFKVPYIYKYKRVKHTDIIDWKFNLKMYIKGY